MFLVYTAALKPAIPKSGPGIQLYEKPDGCNESANVKLFLCD